MYHLPENAKRSRSLWRVRMQLFGDDVFPPAPAWRIISAICTSHIVMVQENTMLKILQFYQSLIKIKSCP